MPMEAFTVLRFLIELGEKIMLFNCRTQKGGGGGGGVIPWDLLRITSRKQFLLYITLYFMQKNKYKKKNKKKTAKNAYFLSCVLIAGSKSFIPDFAVLTQPFLISQIKVLIVITH